MTGCEEGDERAGLQTGLAKTTPDTDRCLKWRYVFAILGSMGMAIIYGLKVNLSIALVAMVNHTAVAAELAEAGDGHGGGHGHASSDPDSDGPFVWSSKQQGAILSAYFVGYFITQVPGGRLSELYSAKYVFLVATLMNSLGAILSPIFSSLDFSALIVVRIVQGLGGGLTFPAMNVLIASWSPPVERSTISSIAYSGASLGTVLSMLSSGVISSTLGWEAIFYIQGGLSLFWCALWVVFVTDVPAKNRFTDAAEVEFIESSKPCSQSKEENSTPPPLPWKAIFTSVPFLTLCFAHFANNAGWYMLLVELPLFARTGLSLDMKLNTVISCVPFFANWIFSVVFSKSLDKARANGWISTTLARKISVGTASLLPAACLVLICLSGQEVIPIITLTILAVMFYGSMYSGVFSNHSDLAPNFAGTLMAITNMLATIPGVLVPLIVGMLTEGSASIAPWHLVFYSTAGILVAEAVIFAIFGQGEIQPWNGKVVAGAAPVGH